MSVIVIGMDMPKNCKECRKASSHEIVAMDCVLLRHTDCPLKSIDGLLDYIKHNIANIAWYFDKDWDDGFDYLSKVIKEYCEVSE